MTPARTDAVLLEPAMTALQGDRVVDVQPVVRHSGMPKSPMRRQLRSAVLPHGGRRRHLSAGIRVRVWFTGFVAWLTLRWISSVMCC
jgi:hypothetical protein